nr:MAG TPA: hypothetical protein [Caudoviricetes sp.]
MPIHDVCANTKCVRWNIPSSMIVIFQPII